MRLRNGIVSGLAAVLSFVLVIALPGGSFAHVVENWDWHLVKGKKKRKLHWCLVTELRKGFPPDAFPKAEADKWKKWAKKAFDNWVKDGKGKPTGWTFEEVSQLDPNCQVLIRFSTRPSGSYGKAVVPSGEKGDQRAKKVPIIINGVDAKGNARKYGRKGKDTLDPVRILKHEVGHAIRLDDTENKGDIMGSGVETEAGEVGKHDTTPSAEDYKEARDSALGDLKVAMALPKASSAGEVAESFATTVPAGPMVDAYIAMAIDAADNYNDLDGAHDWLVRALELDPENHVAGGMLDRIEAAEQQVGLQRMGVALTVLQQMLIRQAEQEERQEGEEHHPPAEEHHPPAEEPH